MKRLTLLTWMWCLSISSLTLAEDSVRMEIRQAAQESLALIEKSTVEYRKQRECFSCHHQAMPVLALSEAGKRGFEIDRDNLKKQLEWTAAHLKRGQAGYLKGRGQGGQADTAGYALWALEAGGWKADETTNAVAHYLVNRHKDKGHWRRSSKRPPSEASDVTTSYLALRALAVFGTDKQESEIAKRRETALNWIQEVEPKDTEELVFQLRALYFSQGDEKALRSAADALLKQQRDDGGWSQTGELESDAYATGTALVALFRSGSLKADGEPYKRGLAFLLKNRLADGSWKVKSRSKPFQKYFESGFPHGKDQFISITASCWATTAMVLSFPEIKDEKVGR